MSVSMEYRRGILFVRLRGRIGADDYLKNIDNLIEDFGIKCVVLNINDLNYVSLDCIDHIIKYNKKILKKKKCLFICDSSKRRNRLFEKDMFNISNELEAFSLI